VRQHLKPDAQTLSRTAKLQLLIVPIIPLC
jgi:hypothetical protein